MANRTGSALSDVFQQLPQGRWTWVGAAFALGWLLFALVWMADRREPAASAVPVQPAAAPETFEPLPRPMAAGDAATPLPAPSDDEAPRLVEEAPPAPTPAPAPAPVPAPPPLPPSIEEAAPAAAAQAPSPLPEQSPSPRYPVAAMRRGEAGSVVLQVQVDAQGEPVSVEVGQASGSRDLDRAAVEAVSRWRFAPARDAVGNPVPGQLSVPIDFKME